MKKLGIAILIFIVIILAIFSTAFVYIKFKSRQIHKSPAEEKLLQTAEKPNLIKVLTPKINEMVRSPLVVLGEARGYWFFEASFPVKLFDGDGNQIAIGIAQAESEWMTEKFVPFRLELIFSTPNTQAGTLVLEKDNPSGLPEHYDELRILVRFK